MQRKRILIVDDEAAVLSMMAAFLDYSDYATMSVTSAEEALIHLQQDPDYDLVLTDIIMPGTDGLELLDQISADYPAIPVVIFTALNDTRVAANAFRRGAIDYLLKPFERAELESIVIRAIEHGRLRKQNAIYRHNLESVVSTRTGRLRSTMQDLERSYDITLEAMGDALDLRDEETQGHSRRVTAYTIALARAMGIETDELRMIARGAFLHDIGKIATPDYILLKPGRLNAEEISTMRAHCERGYEMVRKIPFLREAAEIVYAHQERFDGKGYPRGLRGDEIPLGARVFAIADTLDAMTSNRPYRKGTSFEIACAEIARCAGRQFDPQIVEVFLSLPIESWTDLRAEIGGLPAAALSSTLCRPVVMPARKDPWDIAHTRGTAMKKALTAAEIEDVLRAHPEWQLKDGKLVREWIFGNFVEAMAFVNQVAAIAENAGHHPDIDIRYNHVTLALVSHDAGGITERDAVMAGRISAELANHSNPPPVEIKP
jgi:putative nucleotidyltransferase with HDIG domain